MALRLRARLAWRWLRVELRQRDWRAPLRPWSDFFSRLTLPPSDASALRDRVLLNSHVFQTNYLILMGAVLLVLMLRTPSSLFVAVALLALFVFVTATRPLVIASTRITLAQRRAFAAVAAVFMLLASGLLLSLLLWLSVAALIMLAHAACRHASMRHKLGEIRTHISDTW